MVNVVQLAGTGVILQTVFQVLRVRSDRQEEPHGFSQLSAEPLVPGGVCVMRAKELVRFLTVRSTGFRHLPHPASAQ